MKAKTKYIIDFRMRPDSPEYADFKKTRMAAPLFKYMGYEGKTQPVEELLKEWKEYGVVASVVGGRDLELEWGHIVPNDYLADLQKKYPGKFYCFGGVSPNKGMAAVREVERCIKELGLKGIMMDPYMLKIPASDRRYYPIYAKCAELGVPVILTSGPGPLMPGVTIYDAHPQHYDLIAMDLPELTIIIAHGCSPWVNEAISMVWRHPNVWIDWSFYETNPGSNLYVDACNTMPEVGNKALFGSAHPYNNFKNSVKNFEKLAFTDEVREKVMWKNAARLLNIPLS